MTDLSFNESFHITDFHRWIDFMFVYAFWGDDSEPHVAERDVLLREQCLQGGKQLIDLHQATVEGQC